MSGDPQTNIADDPAAALADLRERYAMLISSAGLMIYEHELASGLMHWSGEIQWVCGLSAAELDGGVAQWAERIHPEDRQQTLEALGVAESQRGSYDTEYRFLHKDGDYVWVIDRGYFVNGPDGTAIRLIGMIQNINALKTAETERLYMQSEVIAAQARTLRELSTPLIPLNESTVVLPLIGTIDSWRARQVMEALLEGVAGRNASVAIIDITGVAVVDTQVANTLIQAARAVRLLGARVILTGMRPEVAQTLVGLGIDLSMIDTRASLQDGIAAALRVAT